MAKNQFQKGDEIALRYIVEELIGSGAFAKVYKVFDKKLKMPKALKIFHKNHHESRSSLRSEARILSKLNHTGIVRVYDYGADSEIIYQDMEFIEGKDLKQFLKENSLSLDQRITLASNIARALEYAHKEKVIHHDIKPQNILINKEGKPKITDFGIAEQFENETKNDQTAGSKAYMSPEKRFRKKTSPKADVFSFGILLHEIFYNEYPFKLKSDETPEYEIPPRLKRSKDLKDKLICDCLSNLPDERPAMKKVIQRLKQIHIQQAPTQLMKLGKFFSWINPIQNLDAKTKKEILLLAITMSAILALIPYIFTILNRYYPQERVITTRFPSSYVAVNFQDKGIRPTSLPLKYGDTIQVTDDEENTIFNHEYLGEDELIFHLENNEIFLNGEKIGQRITSREDLPLSKNLRFVHTDIVLSKKDWINQKHKKLIVSIGQNVPANVLQYLPQNTYYLDINRNRNIDFIRTANLRELKILDNSERELHPLFTLSKHPQLKALNLQNTGLAQSYSLKILAQMKYLNIAQNPISDIGSLHKMDYLRTLDLHENKELRDISPILKSTKLDNVNLKNAINVPAPQVQQLQQQLDSKKYLEILNTKEMKTFDAAIFWIFIALLLILSSQFFRFFLLALKKMKPKSIIPKAENITLPPDFDRHLAMKEINLDLDKNNLVLPIKDNAMEKIVSLSQLLPEDREVEKKFKEVSKKTTHKMKKHYRKKEFEPTFITASEAFKITKDKFYNKWKKKAKKKLLEKNSKIKFVTIKGGTFEMGNFDANSKIAPLHSIKLSNYKLSEALVTNKQFCKFLNAKGNQKDGGTPWININSPYCQIQYESGKYTPKEGYEAFPVFNVSWFGAQRFCNWVGGHLPSEAQWEFAARNRGQQIAYTTGADISRKQANYLVDKNDQNWHSVIPVKSFKANSLGLFDMCGNLMEWCFDNYDPDFYKKSPTENPEGPHRSGISRMPEGKSVRGGAWCYEKEKMRTYLRGAAKPTTRNNFIGFRVAK